MLPRICLMERFPSSFSGPMNLLWDIIRLVTSPIPFPRIFNN